MPRSESMCRRGNSGSVYNTESVVRLVLNACADEQTGEVCITRLKAFKEPLPAYTMMPYYT